MTPISLISGPPAALLSDAFANPTASAIFALGGVYDPGTDTWQRWHQGASSGSALTDVADRSARLLGHVSVDSLPALPAGSNLIGHVDVDNFPATQDVSDRSARLLGHVAVDSLPAADVSDRSARLLGHVSVDNFPALQDIEGIVAVSNFPATQPVSGTVSVSNFPATVDPSDRSGRLLGHVTVDSVAGTVTTDVSDRTARLLGHVTVDNASLTADVSDRSARLLGHVSVDSLPSITPAADASTTTIASVAPQLFNGTTLDRMRGFASGAQSFVGQLASVVQVQNASTTVKGVSSAGFAADGSDGSTALATGLFNWNGSSYDKQRGAFVGTVLASAARTSTQSVDVGNYNWRGVRAILSVTVASGTGGLTLRIRGKDGISGSYYNLNAAPTAVTATGVYVYDVYPNVGAAANGITQTSSALVPRTWNVQVNVGDASSYTYSVSYEGIL